MSLNHKEPLVYRTAYHLTLLICRYVKDMAPEFKMSLGFLLQKETLEFLHGLYQVSSQADKNEAIGEVISRLHFIRISLRLLLELSAMKLETNVSINNSLESSLAQLLAWQKN